MPNILIAVPRIELRYKIRKQLEKEKFDFTESESGDKILHLLNTENYDALIIDIMNGEQNELNFCKKLTSGKSANKPAVIALCEVSNIEIVEDIFNAGASSVVTPPIKSEIIIRKLKDALGHSEEENNKELKPPKILKDIYDEITANEKTLGDVSEILQGLATRDNIKYISETRKNEKWQPILSQNDIRQFSREEYSRYVFFEPRMLLRTIPHEIINSEKIMVARTAPPIRAFIDRENMLSDISIYNIAPVEGLLSEYATAYLNSRIMDFFLRRVRPLKSTPQVGTVLRSVDLEAIPIKIPKSSIQKKFTALVSDIEHSSNSLNSRTKKATALAEINKMLFEIYNFPKEAIDKLNALNF